MPKSLLELPKTIRTQGNCQNRLIQNPTIPFYKKDLTLNVLGPVGDVIGEWIIKGAFVTNGDFGQYD